jgi:CRISPR-associated protein Csm4
MQLFRATIKPQRAFATPLKGDTLFGQICWMLRYLYGNDRLTALLEHYDTRPFMIVSDGFPVGYLPKPTLPSALLGEDREKKKENRKKIWVTSDMLKSWDFSQAKTSKEVLGIVTAETIQMHNSLNYQTFMTDKSGTFAPYGVEEHYPGLRDIYLLFDKEQFSPDETRKLLEAVGGYGYGKDATVGKGRFEIESFEPVAMECNEAKAYMTLSPLSPDKAEVEKIYYEPFTRFGKHGADRAYRNAFKKPLLMADTAAVLLPDTDRALRYTGKAIRGISPAYIDTVHQGYAITWPLEGYDENL